MKKQQKKNNIFIACLIVGLFILIPAFVIKKQEDKNKKYNNWLSTEGIVTKYSRSRSSDGISSFGSKTSSSTTYEEVTFSYMIDSDEKLGIIKTSNGVKTVNNAPLNEGCKIYVLYNPTNHQDIIIDVVKDERINSYNLFMISFISISLGLIGIIISIFKKKKAKTSNA
ncbi:MAG: hypothetical protein KAZ71_01805 [Bacteroidia bacterium]|nr:hypothetical protein [Bacteroidia bacterium]